MDHTANSRRTFIRTVAGGALGGVMLHAFPEEGRARYVIGHEQRIEADDEPFWSVVRSQFPLGREPLYMNNGTMGPSPFAVSDAVKVSMDHVDRTGQYGGWDDARSKIAAFVNAKASEISLTHNVTEGINVVVWGLPLKRGDEVILTNHEHAGNAVPWLTRARRDGLIIKAVDLPRTAAETLNRIESLITRRTRVIAVPHVTCTTGQVLPAKELCALGRTRGIWVMLDAAHTPGMLPLDVQELGCDFLATCGHKWMMGPKGTGFLFVRQERQDLLQPIWSGGGSATEWDVMKGTLGFSKDAHRDDFGSQNAALYTGLSAASDFLRAIGMENVTRRGQGLARRLREVLATLGERVEFLTPDEPGGFGSLLGFRVHNLPFDTLYTTLLQQHNIVTRMVPENGVNANRISTHIYNSPEEVDRLAGIITRLARS